MSPVRICLVGTWDRDFHRNRTLRRLLKSSACEVAECQIDLWGERGDAIVRRRKLAVFLQALVVYPLLIWRFIRTPRPDIVLVPYPGHLDMLVLAPICKLRGIPIVFDIFISLFDTIVSDRGLAGPKSAIGRLSRAADRIACRGADLILADTPPHAEFFAELSGVPVDRFRVLWLGAQEDVFHPRPDITPEHDRVLFHGTFIRLQGLETIVEAAKKLEAAGIRVRLVGDGQERERVNSLAEQLSIKNLERVGMIPLERVPEEIARASVCLGIFGTTEKANRVVPNKLYECLAVGRPVVTGDTAAVRAAFEPGEVVTVPVGDAQALASAILELQQNPGRRESIAVEGHERFRQDYCYRALAPLLVRHLAEISPRLEDDLTVEEAAF